MGNNLAMMKMDLFEVGSDGFAGRAMFHPKAGFLSDGRLAMAVQTIGGGDYYGPVEIAYSGDHGHSWSPPEPVPPLDWRPLEQFPGVTEGVCDTVVDFDRASQCTVFMGHNVFYKDNRFMDTMGSWSAVDRNDQLLRRGVYAVRRPDGTWGPRRYFNPPEFAENVSFCCGCGQRIVQPSGEWLIAFYSMRKPDNQANFVTVYRARFDGEQFELMEHGNLLELPVERGLLEPSLLDFNGRTLVTLRAEDGCGYWSESFDQINFGPIQKWCFDDGETLKTSTTQQHFLKFGSRLFLAYVRDAGFNARIMRFRAPLFMAEVDPERMCLVRASERTVFAPEGDFTRPETVPMSGNFMPCRISENRWLILDGQVLCTPSFSSKVRIAELTL